MVHPSSAENEEARQRGGESSANSRLALRAKPVTMHLSKLPHLRQALQLVGLVAKTARHWDAVAAGGFFKAGLSSIPVNRSAITSAALRLRLKSKVDTSARRKKALL